jgi:hypothetical protein
MAQAGWDGHMAHAGGDGGGGHLPGGLELLGARPLGPQDPGAVGRYRIRALLGIGGMGRVYLGWTALSRTQGAWVAVKVIRPDLADHPEFRRRFARELEAVRRVRTPYAAALVDGEPQAQQPWMATEFVPGVSLSDAVLPQHTLPAPSVWRLAHDLGSALVAVHRADLVHRDVKPSNVILGTAGAKIIDFGVAHASDLSQLTATGMNVGTPSYMAPEQAKSGEVSPAADLFSLGVLLYFAATGRLPFGEGGTAEVLFRVVYEEPDLAPLAALEPGLRDLVLRCMAKNPLQRPNAAGVLALAERAAADGWWAPEAAAAWPEALAVRIAERTLAAVRTLPDPDAVAAAEAEAAGASGPAGGNAAPGHPLAYPGSDTHPRPDETPTTFTGPASGPAGPPSRPGRHRGTLLASAAGAVVVLGLAAGALLLRGPSSHSPTAETGEVGNTSSAATATATASGTSTGGASASATASAAPSATAARSSSAPSPGAATSGAGASNAPGGATTAPAAQTTTAAAPSTSSAGTPNKYAPAQVCGSGFAVVDQHALSGATVYLLYNSSTGYNCVTTMATSVAGTVPMNATLTVQNGGSASDPGNWTYYAGPVTEHAPSSCVEWGGTYQDSSWTSGWSHCG